MSSLRHYDLEEAIRHSISVEEPNVDIDMDELRRNLGAGFDVLDSDHPLKRLRHWIHERGRLGFTPTYEDVLGWIEDDLAVLEKVQ